MAKIHIEYTERDVQRLILAHLTMLYPDAPPPSLEDIQLKVKSKNNYRPQEWEQGELFFAIDYQI